MIASVPTGRRRRAALWTAALVLAAALSPALAQRPPTEARMNEGLPGELRDVAFDQHLGEPLPLDLEFTDSEGRAVRLGDYFGERPVVLVLAYYTCRMLCHEVLNGVASSLAVLSFDAGDEFDVLTVSFDPRDVPESAAAAKRGYLHRYGREDAERGWHFLVGEEPQIRALTEAVGFRYEYDERLDQYAHASGIVVVTPEGRLARYFYGVEFAPRDVRLALVEASENRIGNPVDQLLLYCFQYDPATGKYGAVVMNMLRVGAILTVIGVIALILLLRRVRPRREIRLVEPTS
jgi:protein SCO1/2